MKTRQLTFSAILTALSVVLLFIAGVMPTGRLALVALASLLPAAAVLHCGLGWGAAVYVLSSILALLLLPAKGSAVLYCLLLGHYGVLKSLIERIGKLPLEWVCKIVLYGALLSLLYFAFQWLLTLPDWKFLFPTYLVGGIIGYAIFDWLYTRLIAFYQMRIQPKLNGFFHM